MSYIEDTDFGYDRYVERLEDMSLYEDLKNDYAYERYHHPNHSKQLSEIAYNIINYLKYRGFNIQRYDAYSTNSIYLKLDYGVCNSIRISDHIGKKYLKYRYNMILYSDKSYETVDKYTRYYYTESDIDKLLSQILSDRQSKISKYGVEGYIRFMNKNRIDHRSDKGFWSKSYLV